MSVRKRTWITAKGEPREAWIITFVDRNGDRCQETFAQKKLADARYVEVKAGLKAGTHVAPSKSITVAEAGESWLKAAAANGLERSTVKSYREELNYHITPFIGRLKLSEVSPQVVRRLEDALREQNRSAAMVVRRVIGSLGASLGDAQEQGLTAHNAVRDLRRNRHRGKERNAEKRQKGKLKVGVDIPAPDEIRAIIDHANGRWRPFLITAIFTGLRVSELRGLRWADVNFTNNEINVRQRVDRFKQIGKPKSHAGERSVPFGRFVANTLKEWRLACPKGDLDLVFPSGSGQVENLSNIIRRGLHPAQVAGGVTVDGRAKYPGMHSLRHFYASWCVNRIEDGGLGLPPKVAQERLGHSTVAMTLDTYGHLFPRGDDAEQIDAAELALLKR
jgi:integrase